MLKSHYVFNVSHLIVATFFIVFSMSVNARPQEQVLQKYKLNVQQEKQFCQSFSAFCEKGKATGLYQVKNNQTQFYAIHELKLAYFVLKK